MPRPQPFPQLPIIEADGFRLRPWFVSDAPAFAAASHDPDIVRWTAMAAELDPVAAADFVLGVRERMAEGAVVPTAIADEQDRAIGGVGVGNFDWSTDTGEIFYWLAAEARGRGIATAAVRLLARWAFDALGLARLELLTMPGNVASQRVAERAGFLLEGLQRAKRPVRGVRHDLVVFSRLPSDPDAPAAAPDATGAWIYFIHPSRDNFAATMTDEERAVWGVHWERLKRLYDEGSVILVGPTGGRTNTGICVFEAPDEAAARRLMAEDPAISGGYAIGELRPFHVSLLRGRD